MSLNPFASGSRSTVPWPTRRQFGQAIVSSTIGALAAPAILRGRNLNEKLHCEKPLAHNTWEVRVIREAAMKVNVATQMGIQIHARDNYRRVVELIQTNAIGPVGFTPARSALPQHATLTMRVG